jgi:GNAT superfamily N-acetyltransferase
VNRVIVTEANAKEDLLGLVALNRSDFVGDGLSRWERWQQGGPWVDSDTLNLHMQVMAEAGGIILVARTTDTIVGEIELVFENIAPNTNQGNIAWIVVDPEHRHEGIGTLLLEHTLKIARAKGCTQITTTAEDDEAVSFFQANSFNLSEREAKFTKLLKSGSLFPIRSSIQRIPLQWAPRQQVPLGFEPGLGINYSSLYTWAYLRNMNRLYTLLGVDMPPPNLWLLRQENDEALTTDYQYVRIWLAITGHRTPNFLAAVLTVTEFLSEMNGVSKLTVCAQENQYGFLEARGYQCQETHPFLIRSI